MCLHTYIFIKTFIITYTSIHTYSANICIQTKANINIQDAVRICSSPLRSMIQSLKQKRILHAGERFLIFGRDKHTKLRTYSHSHIHTYSNTYIVTYICTYYICSYIQIIYIHEYVYDGWRLSVPSTTHKSPFPERDAQWQQ